MYPIKLKLKSQTYKINRNGHIFQIDGEWPFTKYGGSGGSSVEAFDPFKKTGTRQLYTALTGALLPELFGVTPTYNKKGRITGYTGTAGFQAPEIYEGQRLAEVSPYQTQALAMGADIPGAYQTAQSGLQQVISNLTGGLTDVFSPIYDYTQRMWENTIAPQTMERFAALGAAGSGGAQSALTRAGEEMNLGMASQLAPLYMQSQYALPSILQQYQSNPAAAAAALYGLGETERGLSQQQLDMAQQIWGEQQPWSNPYLQLLPMALQQPGTTGYVTQQPASFGSSLLSGLTPALGYGLGSSLLGGSGAAASAPSAASWLAQSMGGLGGYGAGFGPEAYAGSGGILNMMGSILGSTASGIGGAASGIASLLGGLI